MKSAGCDKRLNGRAHNSKNVRNGDNGSGCFPRGRQPERTHHRRRFSIFIAASIAWMADGWLENKASLVIQNVILLLINAIGVWRWFPKAEKEAKS
jgi:hypothetical protein